MKNVFILLFFTLILLSCKKETVENISDNNDNFNKQAEILVYTTQGDTLTFDAEIADTPEKSEKGLMYRKHMNENQGMFFIFEEERPLSFWMKNTYIPLDIIFIDSNYQIVSISENCMPLSEQMIPSLKPAQYVLEINAGLSRKFGIKSNQKIIFKDIRQE